MAIATVQLPDGRLADFEVPDDVSDEQALAMANAYLAANPIPEETLAEKNSYALSQQLEQDVREHPEQEDRKFSTDPATNFGTGTNLAPQRGMGAAPAPKQKTGPKLTTDVGKILTEQEEEPIETDVKQPLTPEFRQQVQNAWDAATPEERAQMEQTPGAVGALATERRQQFEQQDTTGLETGRVFDPRAEKRAGQIASQYEGIDPEYAKEVARRGAAQGVTPGAEVQEYNQTQQQIGPSDFDWETHEKWKDTPNAPGYKNVLRGGKQAYLGTQQSINGIMQLASDVVGADELADRTRQYEQYLSGQQEAMGEASTYGGKIVEGSINSVLQQLPFLVMSGGTSELVPLAGAAVTTFGQEYATGKAQGQDTATAVERASLMSALEVIGEKFGLAEQLAALRGASTGMSNSQIVKFFKDALIKEVPGEMLTSTGQFLVDKVPGELGLNQNATFEDYLNVIKDTIATTIVQSGIMTGGATATSSAIRAMQRDRGQGEETTEAEDTRQEALDKWQASGLTSYLPRGPTDESTRATTRVQTPRIDDTGTGAGIQVSGEAGPQKRPTGETTVTPRGRMGIPGGDLGAAGGTETGEPSPLAITDDGLKMSQRKQMARDMVVSAVVNDPDFIEGGQHFGKVTAQQMDTAATRIAQTAARDGIELDPRIVLGDVLANRPTDPNTAVKIPEQEFQLAPPPSETKVSTGPREFPLYTDQELAEKKAQEEKEEVKTETKAETVPVQEEEADEIRKKLGYDKLETEGSLVVDSKKQDKVSEDIIVGNIEAEIDRNGKATRKLYFHFSDPAAEMYTTNVVNNLKAKYNVTPSTEAPGLYDLTRKTEKVELPPAIAKHATAALTAMSQSTTKTGAVDKLVQTEGITKTKANQVINGLIAQGMILKEGNKYRLSDTGNSYIATPTTTKKTRKKTEVPNASIDPVLYTGLNSQERMTFDWIKRDIETNETSVYKGMSDEDIVEFAKKHVAEYGGTKGKGPVRVVKRTLEATETLKSGDKEKALEQLESLKEDLEERTRVRRLKGKTKERGYARVVKALNDAKKKGYITDLDFNTVMWLLKKNPNLAKNLAIYVGKRTRKSQEGAAGIYTPRERLLQLFREINGPIGGRLTPAHELLHHIELLMPPDIRTKIRNAWADAVKDLYQTASDNGDTKVLDYINDLYRANYYGDIDAHHRALAKFGAGALGKDLYKYLNPSEFWAVNATELVASKEAANTWGKKAIQWLKEFIEHIKKVFGLPNDSDIIKSLNKVIKATKETTPLTEELKEYGRSEISLYAPRQRGTRKPKQVKERAGERKNRIAKEVTKNYVDPLRLLKESKSYHQFKLRFRAARKAGKVHSLRGLLATLPMHQIMDLISDEIPEFNNTLDIKTNMDSYRNRRIKADTKITDALVKFYNDTKDSDGLYLLADACHIATLNNVDFSAYENRDEALAKDDDLIELRDSYKNASLKGKVDLQRQITRRENEIKEAYKAWNKLGLLKNGEGRKLWKQMLEKYKADFKEHIDLLIALADQSQLEGDINDETSKKGQLRVAIQARFYRNKKIPVYFPLMRFGPYWARAGKGAAGTTVMFTSATARNAFVDEAVEKQAAKQGMDHKEIVEAIDALKAEMLEKGILDFGDGVRTMRNVTKEVSGNELLKDIFDMIDKSAQPGAPVIDKEIFKDAVFQLFFQTLPDRDIRSRYAKRVGKAGFAADVINNFAVLSNTTANQLARLKYEGLIRNSIATARESIKTRPNKLELAPYIDEMEKRLDIEMGVVPQTARNEVLEGIARFANKFTFIMMLTKPKQFFIQLTQLPTVGLTVLSVDYGRAKAAKTLGRYLDLYHKLGVTELDPETGNPEKAQVSLRNSKYVNGKMLLRNVYDWADTNLNYFNSTRSADMYERSETPTVVMESGVSKGTRLVMNVATGFIHHGERLSREAMFMSAFELALEKRLEEAKQAAKDSYEKAREEVAKWKDVDEDDRDTFADDISTAVRNANNAFEKWSSLKDLQIEDLYKTSPQLTEALIELNQIDGALDLQKKAKSPIASIIEKARVDALTSADDALFNYSRFNKPRVMGTTLGSTAFKFMMFPLSMTGKLAVATYNMFKKRVDLHLKDHYKKAYDTAKKNGLSDAAAKAQAEKEEKQTKETLRKEVRDATITLFGIEMMQFLLGGLEGSFLFFYGAGFLTHVRDAFWGLYTMLGGDDDDDAEPEDLINPLKPHISLYDWTLMYYIPYMFGTEVDPMAKEKGFDKTLKQSLIAGPASALSGWYIGGSTTLNNMYFMDDINADKAEDALDLTVYRMVTGAPGAAVNQAVSAGDLAFAKGEWERGMEKMPSFIGTVPKAFRHAIEGERNLSGVQIKPKEAFGAGAFLGDTLGFTQLDLHEIQSKASLAFKQQREMEKIREDIYTFADKAVQHKQRTGNYDKITELKEKVREFNKTTYGKVHPIENDDLEKSVYAKAEARKKQEVTGIPTAINDYTGRVYRELLRPPEE